MSPWGSLGDGALRCRFFGVLAVFVVCQRCVGGGRKLRVRMDVISLGWELSRGFLCLVNAVKGHRGAGQAPAAAFEFFRLLLELMFLSSGALSVYCQTSALPVLSVQGAFGVFLVLSASGSAFPVLCSDATQHGEAPVVTPGVA